MGEGGIFKQLTKALIERCLSAELDSHLAAEKAEPAPERPKNRRNGLSRKPIQGEFGKAEIGVPRDPLANIFRRETLLQIWLPMEGSIQCNNSRSTKHLHLDTARQMIQKGQL